MNKKVQLREAASYGKEKIDGQKVTQSSFISVDNLLPNKEGIKPAEFLPKGSLNKFNKGDILIGNIRPYLKKIWHAKFGGACSPDVLLLKVKNDWDNQFVFYSLFCDAFFDHMMRGAKGTKMPRGDKNHILDFLIPEYDIKIQKEIANVLASLDAKIECNNCINTELQAMAKTLYDYWFVQFDFPDKNGKPYKSSGGRMVYNEVLKREIPEGWEVKSLYEVADFINGLACQKYRPENEFDEFLPVIKIREMNDGISSNTERAKVNIPDKNKIDDGDVLFSWSATLDVKIWTEGKGALNQHIFKVVSKKFPRTFYYFEVLNYLHHFKMMAELRKTTMGHITIDHLKAGYIPIPPHDLINRLDKRLDSILSKVIISKKESHQLSAIRDWLLPMLMNGQVKVAKAYEPIKGNLQLAAEPEPVYIKAVQLNIPGNKKPFAKQVLAGEIVTKFQNDPNFTEIKFQKIQFLAEHIIEADLNLNYYYQVAGPYDNKFMHTIYDNFRKQKWFDCRNGKIIPLEKHEKIGTYYHSYFVHAEATLNKLFNLLHDTTEAQAEIIATLYAVWNNRIIEGKPVTDKDLTADFYNWSKRKEQYSKKQIQEGLQWLRDNHMEPKGFGKLIKKAKR